MSERPLAVVDIDGVLADVRHRLHHLESRPKAWDAFFAAAVEDAVHAEGRAVLETLAAEHEVVLLSGRPEHLRADTEAWLERHGLPYDQLVLRPVRDRRPARELKRQALRRLARGREIGAVVDDDDEVVEALRADGWPVLHADWEARAPALQDALDEAQEGEGRS